jgi:hypothetical protein
LGTILTLGYARTRIRAGSLREDAWQGAVLDGGRDCARRARAVTLFAGLKPALLPNYRQEKKQPHTTVPASPRAIPLWAMRQALTPNALIVSIRQFSSSLCWCNSMLRTVAPWAGSRANHGTYYACFVITKTNWLPLSRRHSASMRHNVISFLELV